MDSTDYLSKIETQQIILEKLKEKQVILKECIINHKNEAAKHLNSVVGSDHKLTAINYVLDMIYLDAEIEVKERTIITMQKRVGIYDEKVTSIKERTRDLPEKIKEARKILNTLPKDIDLPLKELIEMVQTGGRFYNKVNRTITFPSDLEKGSYYEALTKELKKFDIDKWSEKSEEKK